MMRGNGMMRRGARMRSREKDKKMSRRGRKGNERKKGKRKEEKGKKYCG